MKILRLYSKLPPLSGGMENHMRALSLEQIKTGHRVQLIFNRGQKINPGDIQLLPLIPLYKIRPQALGVMIFHCLVTMHLLLHRKRYDVIHIHGDWSSLYLVGWQKKLTGAKRVICSIHGAVSDYKGLRKKLLAGALKKQDAVIVSGFDSFESVRAECRAYFQPSGISDVFFSEEQVLKYEKFTVVVTAALLPQKNLELFIRIAACLAQFDFIIYGEGPEKEKLMETAAKMKLKNLAFKGFLPQNELANELRKAHLFLFTSLKEGTPTAVLEAMACALPVVSSNAGGLSKIIKKDENGYVIDNTENVLAYIEAIEKIYRSKSLYNRISMTNRLLAKSYSWPVVAANINKIMGDG